MSDEKSAIEAVYEQQSEDNVLKIGVCLDPSPVIVNVRGHFMLSCSVIPPHNASEFDSIRDAAAIFFAN